MKIVHEVAIDLCWPWWKRNRRALIKTGSRAAPALGVLLFLLVLVGLAEWRGGQVPIFSLALACAILIVTLQVIAAHRRANRAAEKRLGHVLTQFVEFTPESVAFGTRHCSQSQLHWDLCRIKWRNDEMTVGVGGFQIPLKLADLEPQHVEQIRFWSTRQQTTNDLCHHCGYDLSGSAGPECPECGKQIRIISDVPAHPPTTACQTIPA